VENGKREIKIEKVRKKGKPKGKKGGKGTKGRKKRKRREKRVKWKIKWKKAFACVGKGGGGGGGSEIPKIRRTELMNGR
jgi:hypothetical protein